MHDDNLLRRFWAKVDKDGPVPNYRPDFDPCWIWTASVAGGGYGKIWATGNAFIWTAHRLSYDIAIGLPDDPELVLDHLCRIRRCVNPAHLEPVTQRENTMRGDSPAAAEVLRTHCPYGHPYSVENTYRWSGQPSQRKCRTCRIQRSAERKVTTSQRQRVAA